MKWYYFNSSSFKFPVAARLWAENDCSSASEISNHLYWVCDEIKDWTINWTFLWFWHYYNWCRMAPNVICTCTLRCDRLFLSADCFEVNPVRSIQNDTIFWWVPKLKLKPSSHLHNILPHITHPAGEHEQKVMGAKGERGFDSVDHSVFIPQGQEICMHILTTLNRKPNSFTRFPLTHPASHSFPPLSVTQI